MRRLFSHVFSVPLRGPFVIRKGDPGKSSETVWRLTPCGQQEEKDHVAEDWLSVWSITHIIFQENEPFTEFKPLLSSYLSRINFGIFSNAVIHFNVFVCSFKFIHL